jgi:hypothetical protein
MNIGGERKFVLIRYKIKTPGCSEKGSRVISEYAILENGPTMSKPTNTLGPNRPFSEYHPTGFRYSAPTLTLQDLTLDVPNFEPWLLELWHDFLIEPTPYLVASAILYLGFILLLAKYYGVVWWIVSFLLQFVPWDEDLGAV